MRGRLGWTAVVGLWLLAACASWPPGPWRSPETPPEAQAPCSGEEKAALEAKVRMLQGRVADLQAQLDAEKQRAQALEGQIEQLKAIERILERRETPGREVTK